MAYFHSPQIVKDGLVLLLDAGNSKSYPGTGTTWIDLSRNENNGTLTNGPTFNNSNSGCVEFDGVDDFVQLPLFIMDSNAYTVSSWINITDFTTGKTSTGRVFIRRTGTNFSSMVAFYNGGYAFETTTNSNPHELAGRTTGAVLSNLISAGSWFYFSLVFDANIFYGYLNGVQNGSAALSSNLNFDRIGDGSSLADNYPGYFKGTVANFQLYNRALTAAEVLQNYNATKGRFGL